MKKNTNARPTRRNSFLLLELVVSLGLILACLFPLLKSHMGIRQEEIAYLEKLKVEGEAYLTLSEIKTALFEKKYTWKQLASEVEGELDCKELEICSSKRSYQRSYKIRNIATKNRTSIKKSAHFVSIDLELRSPKKTFYYSFPLVIEGFEA